MKPEFKMFTNSVDHLTPEEAAKRLYRHDFGRRLTQPDHAKTWTAKCQDCGETRFLERLGERSVCMECRWKNPDPRV